MAVDLRITGLSGCGKTHALLKRLEEELDSGYVGGLADTCFCTFRVNMAEDIKQKLRDKLGATGGELQWVTTMDGICKRLLNVSNDSIVDSKHKKEFAQEIGMDYKKQGDEIDPADTSISFGAAIMFDLYDWLAGTNTPIKRWSAYPNYWRVKKAGYDSASVECFVEAWDEYKEKHGLFDFVDMLKATLEDKIVPPVSALFVDEFQDFTPLRFEVFKMWAERVDFTVVAGDPFQCIYPFWGAKPEFFTGLESEEKVVLPVSYRFGEKVWDFSRRLLSSVGYALPEIEAQGGKGTVRVVGLRQYTEKLLPHFKANTFHLVRCHYMAHDIAWQLAYAGVPFVGDMGWSEGQIRLYNGLLKLRRGEPCTKHELVELIRCHRSDLFKGSKAVLIRKIEGGKKYLYSVEDIKSLSGGGLRRYSEEGSFYESIFDDVPLKHSTLSKIALLKIQSAIKKYGVEISVPSVYLGTIHSVKGLEADTVFVWDEINRLIHKHAFNSVGRSEEARVWFVAATRARHNLFWVRSETRYPYTTGVKA
jgi:superfamily I DNA/RNA helicase